MTWLPKTTASRVTIVISTLPEPDFDVVPAMKKHIPEANCFNVDHLTTDTAKVIMEKCLSSESRRLTAVQTSMILEAFKKSPYPLFLKLMMEEAKRWKSHFDITGFIPPDSSREAIAMFYERLENEHGKVIVSHALGYIVAARDGITENEMLDLLSLDNEVLHEAYEHWSPPTTDTVRVPSFSWTRLYYDLSKYLVRRQAGNHTVLALYHRQFIEVAREKYLRCSAAFTIYSIMKEYFLGTYSNEFTKFLKLKMWNSEKQVNRRVANQPLRFSSNVFNNRKLRELPYCLLKGTFLKELKTNVFADPNWILMKSAAFSIKEVIEDYNMYLSTNQDIEIALIRDAIKLAKPTLEFPGARNHFCVELYCRLKFFEQRFPRFLGSLVNKSLNILEETPSEMIVPRNSSFQSPGGPLRATITGLKTPVTCLKFSNQLDIFAGGSKDGCILIWDCENDEALQRIEASASAIVAIAFSESGDKLASASEDGEVTIFNIETGHQCFQVSTNGITNAKIMISGHNVYVVGDRKVVSWNFLDNTKTFKKQIDTKVTCSMVHTEEKIALILVGKIDGTCLSINAKTGEESSLTEVCHSPMIDIFMSTIQGHIILVWENGRVSLVDGATLSCKYSVTVGKPEIKQCSLCESGRALTLATARDVILCTIIDDKFKWVVILANQHEQIRKISFIRDNIVAVAYEDRRVMLWDISQDANPKAVATWDGTGAPIDYMEFGKNIGVTASCKVFYLKVWDIDEDDEIQLAPSLPLRHNSSTLSNNGQYLAYEENGSLVTRKTTDFVSDERSVSSWPIRADNDDVTVKALRFAGSNMIILFNSGLLQKLSGKTVNKDGLLTYFIGDSLKLPIECTTYLTLSVTENGEMAMVLMTDVNQNHIFYFVNISTFLQVSKIILGTDDSTGRISALTITDTACTKVFAGTTTGELLSLEFDFHDNSGRVVSSQSKHGNEITCLVISFSGKYLFSGSTGRKRRLWELNGSSFLMKHELHFESLLESGVTAAQFSHDDEYLITGSKERSITVWNSHTGNLVGTLYVYAPVLNLVLTTSNTLVYTSELGYVGVAQFRPHSTSPIWNNDRDENRKSRVCILM